MFFDSPLKKALKAFIESPSEDHGGIEVFRRTPIGSLGEARLVVKVLPLLPPEQDGSTTLDGVGATFWIVNMLRSPKEGRSFDHLATYGAPELLKIVDRLDARLRSQPESEVLRQTLMLTLSIATLYAPAAGDVQLRRAALSPLLRDAGTWRLIFGTLSHEDHPWRVRVVDLLRDPLPEGGAGQAYLELCNSLSEAEKLNSHPFNTDLGMAMIERWLQPTPNREDTYAALSAVGAIPFLDASRQASLYELASANPNKEVELAVASTGARLGNESAMNTLIALAREPQFASVAIAELESIGFSALVPAESRTADFQALSIMSDWLAHPNEYGRAPDAISLTDTRELYWPPTQDARRLWLCEYTYNSGTVGDEPDIGYGLVGSITFSLFGDVTPDHAPVEMYALHCAWELQMLRDPRAPSERTVAAGMALLSKHNPGFGLH